MAKDRGVPGNTLASQVLFDRQLARIGAAVQQVEHALTVGLAEWGVLKALRFRPPGETSSEWLVVVTAVTENGGVVGFHSADSLSEAITGLAGRLRNGSIVWKADVYHDQ